MCVRMTSSCIFQNFVVLPSLMRLEIAAQLGFSFWNVGPCRVPLLASLFSSFLFPQLMSFCTLSGASKKITLLFCLTFQAVFRVRLGLKQLNLPVTELKVCYEHFSMKIILRFNFAMFLFFYKNLKKIKLTKSYKNKHWEFKNLSTEIVYIIISYII